MSGGTMWINCMIEIYDGFYGQTHYCGLQEIPRRCGAVIEEIFGHNRLRSECLQVQPEIHVDILRFSFIEFGVFSMNSSTMMRNFPAVLNFSRLFLKLDRFICN
jgi:hypothetical protein